MRHNYAKLQSTTTMLLYVDGNNHLTILHIFLILFQCCAQTRINRPCQRIEVGVQLFLVSVMSQSGGSWQQDAMRLATKHPQKCAMVRLCQCHRTELVRLLAAVSASGRSHAGWHCLQPLYSFLGAAAFSFFGALGLAAAFLGVCMPQEVSQTGRMQSPQPQRPAQCRSGLCGSREIDAWKLHAGIRNRGQQNHLLCCGLLGLWCSCLLGRGLLCCGLLGSLGLCRLRRYTSLEIHD